MLFDCSEIDHSLRRVVVWWEAIVNNICFSPVCPADAPPSVCQQEGLDKIQ